MILYKARAVQCMDCGNWEEQGQDDPRSHFVSFSFDYPTEIYTCKCGSKHVMENILTDQRDE